MTRPVDPPEVEDFTATVTTVDKRTAHVQAVVDGRLMTGTVPAHLTGDVQACVALLIEQAREQARLRAAGARQPQHLPAVPPCTGCGSKVNPMTGECAGCSD